MLLILCACEALGQSVQWVDQRPEAQRTGKASCGGVGRGAALAPNGDVIVAGCTTDGSTPKDALLARLKGASGEVVWSVTRDGGASGSDGYTAVAVDAAGDIIAAGFSSPFAAPNSERYRVTKYNGATGVEIWSADYAPGGTGTVQAVAIGPTGDAYVTGAQGGAWRTMRFDGATGAVVWNASLNGSSPGGVFAPAIAVDAAGNAYVTGSTSETGPVFVFRTTKFEAATGTPLWSHIETGDGGTGHGREVALDPAGNLFVAGSVAFASTFEFRILRLDPATGVAIWTTSISSPSSSGRLAAMAVSASGDVFIAGISTDSFSFVRTLRVTGNTGLVVWDVAVSLADGCGADRIAVDASGDALIAGFNGSGQICAVKRRGSDGTSLWRRDSGAESYDWNAGNTAVALDANGNLFSATTAFGAFGSAPGTREVRVARYEGSSGVLSWGRAVQTYSPGPLSRGLSIPRAGRIAAIGTAFEITGRRVRLSLHDTSDGHALWDVLLVGWDSNFLLQQRVVAIDPSGNVAVTMRHVGGFLRTTLHAAANGAVLWTADSVSSPRLAPVALTVDAAGDVIVIADECLLFDNVPCTQASRAMKYANATGAEVWSKFTNSYYYGNVATDSQRHVIFSGGGTVKYHADSGVELWNRTLSFGQMAVDLSDNVVGRNALGLVKLDGATGNTAWMVDEPQPGFSATGFGLAAGIDPILASIDVNVPRKGGLRRYASADGARLWARQYLRDDLFFVMPWVDTDGNVTLVGTASGGSEATVLFKFHGTTGRPLWSLDITAPGQGSFRDVVGDSTGGLYLGSSVGFARSITKVSGGRTIPANLPSTDFDGSGAEDLLFANTDGRAAIWLMNGTTATATAEILGAGTGWSVTNVADFNGDGRSDLVWRHTDGRISIDLMNGTAKLSSQQLLNAGGWSVTHTPDVNGDGKADLLFTHADGTVAVWTMSGTAMTGGTTIMGPGSDWSVIRTADFDGDGMDDLLWRHTDGRHAIWLMNGLVVKSTAQILNAGNWTATHTPDLNGDGKADLVWQNTDGTIAAWLMNGTAMTSGATLLNAGAHGWTVTRVGDFDGDGNGDLFFLNADGRAAIYLMNGLVPTQTTQVLNAGGGWSAKRLVDLNGDGKADIVWENIDGRTAVWLMIGTTMTSGTGIIGAGTGWSVSAVSQ
ncbi:hypothetical protein BWI17_14615 [Betaproteobacteria bacterium GR16-43]|nr:hypothetical protein BWI17_14615 [Betaproteobacteria bacterium GR16-43]